MKTTLLQEVGRPVPAEPDVLFTKIINREIPADIIFEDDLCIAFHDVNPAAPFHALVVPKKPLRMLSDAKAGQEREDQQLLGHLLLTANAIVKETEHEDFRVVINNGPQAAQSVYHLHVHVLAGRQLTWPPG
jgi:histidine triad (HIT) family protein